MCYLTLEQAFRFDVGLPPSKGDSNFSMITDLLAYLTDYLPAVRIFQNPTKSMKKGGGV